MLRRKKPGRKDILGKDIYNDKDVITAHNIVDEEYETLKSVKLKSDHWEDSYYTREADRTKEYHQANMHKMSTSKLLSEQSRIRQLFDKDSKFNEVSQIDKYTAIGEVEDGVTNTTGDITIRHETHCSNHTKARDNTKQGEEESVTFPCDLTFQSKKRLRRHMLKEPVIVGKLACKNCENMFKTWKDLRVHIYKTHENEKDKEGNKKEISDDNVAHKDEDENDETGLRPNCKGIKKGQ